ncbi:helix-turn-helix transcriptional regulator [Mycobacteroides abscessus]|uniref:helix-turn-helix transcriptional regulator n=1 Tax=Mycobacteroides abscessus TaxID=36809 RepID=UPI00188EE43D|nr:helix-turn-helix transcriptional regulator [Mycobacteroides abscessus]
MSRTWTMSEAAGASARAIRQDADATLSDVAKAARDAGLAWSSGRVGDFESGRIAPSLPTLIAIAGALTAVSQGKLVGLPDLFAVDGYVQINEKVLLTTERMRELVSGGGFRITLGDLGAEGAELSDRVDELMESAFVQLETFPENMRPSPSQIGSIVRDFTEGDDRIARALGVSKFIAAALMAATWGKTFVQRRDEVAGPDANAQKKGIVTRKLQQDLRNLTQLLDL